MAKGKTGNHHGWTSPDEKMGRDSMGCVSSTVRKAAKKRANAKRRRRDKETGYGSDV